MNLDLFQDLQTNDFHFPMFFQDQMPNDWDTEKVKWSTMKVNINVLVGSRLPYGSPGNQDFQIP